ncbi:LysR family transcriptional regulator [Rhizobium pusense]|uniref:LysR family transcriptional regulator n=1 Tax=Agrobacterium pusense TaxID=648995 RepID=UPI000D1B5C46|nr:LysR family transcriptional regulator [Agrobacterium pusense]MDH0912540.1 LysR family transcriptional regulator [Agrobacterium pusense]MDH1098613.1 LysR family transcriptional regulator [Agrobacterium pusense]MDH1115228.1 LysR family transcriptional regulator [Agrobacterium pusense]MDH2197039.1 LysR family transcriptional regulator [Agrobacterium pusense]
MDKVLVQFLAVAEEGSISGAATSLLVTQPTLTFNLKKLEQMLGVALFERSSRGVTLTRYGETLYEHVSIMRRLYDNALDSIERQRLQIEDGLSIGSGYSWWTLFLKDIVLEHGKRHPDAPVNVTLGNTLRCMDQLLAGDISLFIGHRIDDLVQGVRADFLMLGMIRDGFFVREAHPLLEAARTLQEVSKYPSTLAFPPEARQQRLLLEPEHGDRGRRQPEYIGRAFTSNSLDACLQYVSATDAVLRHTNLMAPTFSTKGLRMVSMLPGEQPKSRPVGIYVLPERRIDKRVSELIALIQARAAPILDIDAG